MAIKYNIFKNVTKKNIVNRINEAITPIKIASLIIQKK